MIWVELTATVFGFLCVWLLVRQSIWCWPTGLVQVSLYIVVFFRARLYSDLILHVIYVFLQLYGWYHWTHGRGGRPQLPVTRLRRRALAAWIGVAAAGTAGWGTVMAVYTDAAAPYPDAFTTAASLVAQWLQARKRVESWWFWIAVDVVAVAVYLYKGLYPTTVLYAAFLVLSVMGSREWRRAMDAARRDDGSVAAAATA